MRQTAFSIALIAVTMLTNVFLGCAILNYVVGGKASPYTLYPPYCLAGLTALWWGFAKIRENPEKVRAALAAFCCTFFVPLAGGLLTTMLRFMSSGYGLGVTIFGPAEESEYFIIAVLLYLGRTVPLSMAAFGLGCIFAIPLLAFNIFMFTAYRQALRGTPSSPRKKI